VVCLFTMQCTYDKIRGAGRDGAAGGGGSCWQPGDTRRIIGNLVEAGK